MTVADLIAFVRERGLAVLATRDGAARAGDPGIALVRVRPRRARRSDFGPGGPRVDETVLGP